MNEELEMQMADLVQSQSPEEAAAFVNAMREAQVSEEQINDIRILLFAVLEDPTGYEDFAEYLAEIGLSGIAPPQFDIGFLMTLLGFIGLTQRSLF